MRRQFILSTVLGLTALSAVAVAANAQEVRIRRSPDRTFTYFLEGDSGTLTLNDSRRGRIGITVSLAPARGRDTIGAHVQAVTEGGPADRAGVRAGDLIVRWNDVRLADGRGGEEDEFRSRPGQRLMSQAQRLEPGDTVRLDIRRDNRPHQFTVIADSADMDRIVERMRIPLMREGLPFMGPDGMLAPSGAPRMRVMAFGGLGDLELVRVSPQMAENLGLGVSEGLMVVDVDSASTLGLRAGDVILTIGGRRATSPEHAMRILSTYEPQEAVQFEVQRQRRRQTVNGRLPEPRGRMWRTTPGSFERVPDFLHPDLPFREMQRVLPAKVPGQVET